jgi:2-pyrone-4,6-dicarboxylate lactonase
MTPASRGARFSFRKELGAVLSDSGLRARHRTYFANSAGTRRFKPEKDGIVANRRQISRLSTCPCSSITWARPDPARGKNDPNLREDARSAVEEAISG